MTKIIRLQASTVVVILMALYSAASAGMTGKINGTVIDSETSAPLIGANVILEGTAMGAATNEEGYYFIIGVPPGAYTVRAEMIGYATFRTENVLVFVDRTAPANFSLPLEAIPGEEVTVTAQREVVELDVSNTRAVVLPEEIETHSYHELIDVLVSQPGIEGENIRGGGITEAQFMVDGMLVEDELTDLPYMKVNLSTVQEVQIITGGFNAEYGDVRSGLINVVTKDGADHYTASVDLKYGPPYQKHFGPNAFGRESFLYWPYMDESRGSWTGGNEIFDGWVDYANNTLSSTSPHYGEPKEAYALWLWRHRSPDAVTELRKMGYDISDDDILFAYGDRPDWRAEISLGGPVPVLKNTRFFASYRSENTAYALGKPEPVYQDQHATLKLTTHITPKMKITAKVLYGWQRGMKASYSLLSGHIDNNPFHNPAQSGGAFHSVFFKSAGGASAGGIEDRLTVGLSLTHALSQKTFYELHFSHIATDYDDVTIQRNAPPMDDPKNPNPKYTGIKDGRLGTDAEVAEEGWEEHRKIKIGDYWYDESPRYFSPANWKDVSGYFFMAVGKDEIMESYSNTTRLKGSLTSQVNRTNQVKTGFEISFNDVYGLYESLRVMDKGSSTHSVGKPTKGALYLQDKLEFEGLIANLGLRADFRKDPNAYYFGGEVDTALNGIWSSHFLKGAGTVDTLDYLPTTDVTNFLLSPRVGISHPISDRAKVFFNYGHFYQWPSFGNIYEIHIQHALVQNRNVGNPDLIPPRTIQYEVGFAQNIANRLELTLSGYYKDISDEITNQRYTFQTGGVWYDKPINNQYRDIRGIEVKLHARQGRFITGWLTYNYMIKSSGKWGLSNIKQDPLKDPVYVSSNISQADVQPTLRVSLNLHTPAQFGPKLGPLYPLGGFNCNLLFYWREGEKFTWNPDKIPYVEDNEQWRSYHNTDLRFSKRLFPDLKGVDLVFYVDVFNLFNFKYMPRTGYLWDPGKYSGEFTAYMESLEEDDTPGDFPRGGEKEHIVMPNMDWWTFLDTRQIFAGLRFNFR